MPVYHRIVVGLYECLRSRGYLSQWKCFKKPRQKWEIAKIALNFKTEVKIFHRHSANRVEYRRADVNG